MHHKTTLQFREQQPIQIGDVTRRINGIKGKKNMQQLATNDYD